MEAALTVVGQLHWIAIVDNSFVDDDLTVIVDLIAVNTAAALFIVLCNFDFILYCFNVTNCSLKCAAG